MINPTLSVIIPARNEERYLPKCLEALYASALKAGLYREMEIVVVANRCTDRTPEIARDHQCRVIENPWKNLSKIRNDGVRASRGEFVVTVDADSIVSENMLFEIMRALSDPEIIGGGVVIWPERWSLGIALTGLLLVPLILKYRVSGGLFYFRRPDFEKIHGFDPTLSSLEDVDFAVRLKALGKETKRNFKTLWNASIMTSCRKFDHFGDWYFVKNPRKLIRLLGGKSQEDADEIWYDIER